MKKSVWLFVVLAILCVIGSAAAQGIGSPESPVKVTYLCKDVNYCKVNVNQMTCALLPLLFII